ncbi:sirohydrochlorin chelatase [Solibacillus sp. FSL K6-1126]|uniref:sirohydrochlorin chelatase n=1 Tax=Solibacillus sp. FSL K6-1126 TaxID=2921463 RepID=UPI0030F79C79
MRAILYVGHGTRLKKGADEAIQFLETTKSYVETEIQETAFLELVEPNILEGVAKCVNQGATHISVVPILLLTAQHANEDIPAEIKIAKERYPHVTFSTGRPFGIHPALIETVYERIVEQQVPINADAEVLLIGRGSSDIAVVRDMARISEQLKETYGFREVKSCFLYGAGPSFDQTLVELKFKQTKQVFIVPYLLFSGLLSVGIEKRIRSLDLDSSSVILCNHLGYNEKVRNVLLERVQEVI